MKHVVKRKGHTQPYDEKKVYASCYAAALNCHYSEEAAEKIADKTTKKINAWMKKKKSISSHDIRTKIEESIDDNDVVLMYRHHLDLC